MASELPKVQTMATPFDSPLSQRDKSAMAEQKSWTVWEEVSSVSAALGQVSAQCQQMQADLVAGLRKLERMLGSIPAKRP